MCRVHYRGVLVSVYRIDVRGNKWYWPHYINTVDVLKNTAFKVFKLINPDAKMDVLAFTLRVAMHYLKKTKVKRQLLPNIICPTKWSWKANTAVPENESKKGNHFFYSQKECTFHPKHPRTWCPIWKVVLCMEPCFKAFYMS